MRGRAYRIQKARNKYARRVNQIFYSSGGYKIVDDCIVRCESVKDYLESENPYALKNQGNFEHWGKNKYLRRKQLKHVRRESKILTNV